MVDISRDVRLVIAALLLVILLGFVVSIWIVKSITSEIEKVSALLEETSGLLKAESTDINDACDNLSSMAATQAASLEETAAALEEVTSMSKRNTENVQRTNEETNQVVKRIEEGSAAVSDMATAMSEIEDSAGKIGNIIKTIEAIAFQTNLLALNAAVEAARAGEAGQGFAVVADEVRNLAQRSTQAAQETTTLIHGTVDRVRRGVEISQRLGDMFQQIDTSAHNSGQLVTEITSAINEQSQGIDQIAGAVSQIDRATQQNAANADKVRRTAGEIADRTQDLIEAYMDLHRLVYGGDGFQPPAAAARTSSSLKLPPPR
jgi:methyl-accepting chemotaxis protein